MIGLMPSGFARVHQSPISSKSQAGRVCPTMKAISLARSSPDPPPKAITPSKPPSRKTRRPSSRFFSVGFGSTSANKARPKPADSSRSSVRWVMSKLARPRSVTSNGFWILAVAQASAISAIRPAPKRMAVGYDQFPTSFIGSRLFEVIGFGTSQRLVTEYR